MNLSRIAFLFPLLVSSTLFAAGHGLVKHSASRARGVIGPGGRSLVAARPVRQVVKLSPSGCSATLLEPLDWVMSAAHCLHGARSANVSVLLGAAGAASASCHVHPDFRFTGLSAVSPHNDILLCRLNASDKARARERLDGHHGACLATSIPKRDVEIVGYGAPTLNQQSRCTISVVGGDGRGANVMKNKYCAGSPGDSGGGVLDLTDETRPISYGPLSASNAVVRNASGQMMVNPDPAQWHTLYSSVTEPRNRAWIRELVRAYGGEICGLNAEEAPVQPPRRESPSPPVVKNPSPEVRPPSRARAFGESGGVQVDAVVPSSAAARAGFQVGDRIVSVGGNPILDLDSFHGAFRDAASSDEAIPFEVERNGRRMVVRFAFDGEQVGFTLGERRPSSPSAAPPEAPDSPPSQREGPSLDPIESEGVHVNGVSPSGAAARAGFQVGDRIVSVGGSPISDLDSFHEAFRAGASAGDEIPFEVERGGARKTLRFAFDGEQVGFTLGGRRAPSAPGSPPEAPREPPPRTEAPASEPGLFAKPGESPTIRYGVLLSSTGTRTRWSACGATRISPRRFITAAHCIEGGWRNLRTIAWSHRERTESVSGGEITVVFGSKKTEAIAYRHPTQDIAIIDLPSDEEAPRSARIVPVDEREELLPNKTKVLFAKLEKQDHLGRAVKPGLYEASIVEADVEHFMRTGTRFSTSTLHQPTASIRSGDSGSGFFTRDAGTLKIRGVLQTGGLVKRNGVPIPPEKVLPRGSYGVGAPFLMMALGRPVENK